MMRPLLAIVVAIVGFAGTAHAATKPSFRVEPASVSETALLVPIRIDKSAIASSYSKISVRTVDGTAKAGVDYTPINTTITFSNSALWWSVPVAVSARPGYQGNRSFTVHIAAVRNATIAQADAIVTILESEQPPAPTQTCPDGSVILAAATCPVPVAQWLTAPLQDGGFARVKANDSLWDITGPGSGRQLQAGEIVAVYFNGWGYDADGTASFAIYALSDGSSGRAKAADLAGVAPVGTPPGLPASWWVPGLVTGNKTCTDPRAGHEGQPGVTQGGVYRAAMLAGSHTKLATGVAGSALGMWQVFGSGDLNSPASAAFTVVTGDCLTGQ